MKNISVREIYELYNEKQTSELDFVNLQGWIKTNRDNGSIGFIDFNDGTYFKNIQLVYDNNGSIDYEKVAKYSNGSAIGVAGKFVLTPNSKQPFEIVVEDIVLEGDCDNDYPLQKKRHSFEFLREISHLRARTNTFRAVFRIRSVLAMAIHEFFQSQNFIYVHSPIITGIDAEGSGEEFTVTTRKDAQYDKDFFGKRASLTVSGQLNAEAFALAFRDVYTFGPTFRAENSNTVRHASEFWMIEPEVAFADLEDNMNLIESLIKYCIEYTFYHCPEEMKFLDERIDKGLIARLEKVEKSEFARMEYSEAIEKLKEAIKNGVEFENKDIVWGMDLQSEHERYICEKVIDGPVFLINYPKDIKAFYMRQNDDGKTVAACDLLVPFVGELVGGSQREERYDYLVKRMDEMNINKEDMQWYLDLRRYGGCYHSGFGVGFERLIMYLTGMQNIRDVLPFPRTPKNMKY